MNWCRRKGRTVEERFIDFIEQEPNSGCWLWIGALSAGGYSNFWDGIKFISGHRYSFSRYRRNIPPELELDHICKTRSCVNPKHLEPVTHLVNISRGNPATKIRCIRGHDYSEENTGRWATGRRHCKACEKERAKRRWADGLVVDA